MSRKLMVLVALCALYPSTTLADGPGYKICNNSPNTYAISYIYRDGLGVLRDYWTWSGYFLLKGNSCGFHLPTHNAAHVFINLNKFNPPSTLGRAVHLSASQFRTSNRGAEIGERMFCTYSTGRRVSKPISDHKKCSGKAAKKYYTIYWTGIGLTHRQVNRSPHTLTLH